MDIREGEARTLTLQNASIDGFKAAICCIATNGTDVPVKTDIDYTKMLCRCVLTRDGSDTKRFNLNLAELVAFEWFLKNRYDQVFGSDVMGVAAAGKGVFGVRFGLGQMNLKNSDVLTLEIELKAGFFQTAGLSKTSSYVRVEGFNEIGIERSIPEILSYTLETNVEQYKLNLGNGISKIMFYAKGSTAVPADGLQAISTLVLDSEKGKLNEKFIDLVNRRVDQFVSPATAVARGENLLIVENQILNNVNLEFEFVPGKITVAKYKIFALRQITSQKALIRSDATEGQHAYENAMAMGVNLTAEQRADYARLTRLKGATLQA